MRGIGASRSRISNTHTTVEQRGRSLPTALRLVIDKLQQFSVVCAQAAEVRDNALGSMDGARR
jgi:hypothetical protein